MKLDDEIDDLFALPLAEFTGARNALSARLKKEGRANDAERIKLMAKPSVSAWAVNQLYWKERDAFDQLIAAGKRFDPARASGKARDMRESLDVRREALTNLSELASALLVEAGHNPSQDTLRRITTSLEALSAFALLPDGPTPGRLTQDLDPPSFESLALLLAGAGSLSPRERAKTIGSSKKAGQPSATKHKEESTGVVRRLEEARRFKIVAAKSSLQEAKRALTDARANSQTLEAAQKKISAEVREAEKERREAEQRFQRATATAEAVTGRAESISAELEEATKAFREAKRNVENATKELESLLREPSQR